MTAQRKLPGTNEILREVSLRDPMASWYERTWVRGPRLDYRRTRSSPRASHDRPSRGGGHSSAIRWRGPNRRKRPEGRRLRSDAPGRLWAGTESGERFLQPRTQHCGRPRPTATSGANTCLRNLLPRTQDGRCRHSRLWFLATVIPIHRHPEQRRPQGRRPAAAGGGI